MNFGEKIINDVSTSQRNHSESLYLAAVQLDDDLHAEAMEDGSDPMSVRAAISGAVACWAYVTHNHLYVGNVGDSAALLIQSGPGKSWKGKKMSSIHSGSNEREVQRINSEHPAAESRTVLRNQRLLGCLSPLRAFGDCRFKLSLAELNTLEDRNFDFDNDGKDKYAVWP